MKDDLKGAFMKILHQSITLDRPLTPAPVLYWEERANRPTIAVCRGRFVSLDSSIAGPILSYGSIGFWSDLMCMA